jgi:Pectate lyase superfamily protein
MKLTKYILFIVAFCAFVSTAGATPVDVTQPPYGAVGNGYTDNRIAIQNAINSVAGTGGTVYFPAGYFNVSGTLYVPSNVRLQGMKSHYNNCQIRLTSTGVPLFEVGDGKSGITFKDLTLYSLNGPEQWPRTSPAETQLIRGEGTTGISLKAAGSGINNIVIENVRTMRFTRGISATSSIVGYDAIISNVKIRNNASDGNEYSLYTNTRGADGWDIQNMDVYPMNDKQNGIFLELSGKMSFLQLSCAGNVGAGICAKLWGNGDTYFRQMHVEGPRLGFCVGSNCEPNGPTGNMGENPSLLTIENSATNGEFYRATNLVSINNRFWLDYPQPPAPPPPAYKFAGTGTNSWLVSCGNVWVSWNPNTHMTNTTVTAPSGAFPGLATNVNGCVRGYISSVPAFAQGYLADNERLGGEVSVTTYGATPNDTTDDTTAFLNALAAARSNGGSRVFIPSGTYDISSTLQLYDGETFLGEPGSTIRLKGTNLSVFKVVATQGIVKGITLRNLILTAVSPIGTVGIDMDNFSASVAGGASDFQIQGVNFTGFETGISVHPVGGTLLNANPMFDSVSLKNADFSGNKTAILIRSQNASNWNLENITVNIPNGEEGVRVDGIGHLSIRNLSCTSSGTGSACVTVQRQNGLAIDGLSATNVTNALVARWENGWTQFPFTLRNSNLTAGVYFQGRVYLNSVNNIYPAKLQRFSTSKVVKFGAYQEGDVNNIAYGGQSDIFSCNDTFRDTTNTLTQSTWAYTGTLSKPVTYCY